MMNNIKFKRTIPVVFDLLNAEDDPAQILYYQNLITCMWASPLLFLGALANIIVVYFFWGGNLVEVLLNSGIFLLLGLSFEFISRKELTINLFDHLVSLTQSITLAFIVVQYYQIIGPAVWSVSFVMIILSLMRLKITMLYYIAITTFVCGLYVTFLLPVDGFLFSPVYFLIQNLLFCFIFCLASATFYLNLNRYDKAVVRLNAVTSQKEKIARLYKKLILTKKTLTVQNQELQAFNEEIRKNEERLHFLAYYDGLTELPNRKMILERLHLLVNLSENEKASFFIVFIDLDNFKKINDTMGHLYGDDYLRYTAKRLKELVHEDDLLGRLGGDEFALIIQRNIKEDAAYNYVESLRNELCDKIKTSCSEFKVSASFGISVFPQDGKDPIELLNSADTSMYKAKELGRNNIQFFRPDMKEEILNKIQMESLLLKAYENKEFFIEYQPQFNAEDHHIRGFEALIRWDSPHYGRVAPMNFIPLAEEMGLIIGIGHWVLLTACHKFKELDMRFDQNLCVSVNVSAVQMRDKNFVDTVKNVLSETSMDPRQLELEITESLFIDNIEETIDMLNEIKALNVRISLDDFGTGFSSLSYLRRLPIDTLKIDKSFIDDLSDQDSSIRIVGDIISLGHNLDAHIVAEGIENSTQLDYLKANNCDCIQGFMFGKPMSVKDMEALLQKNPLK
ncbi:EAL domain-containing protein [Acetobacterium wieringae]|uniref:EAL domain-containing protein n=1 Tax=Acetobacterium wieringae TaxID=52694 RepID=A0ABY6HIS6_9FIRM|nr:EAL domain-containing protein [Acetobacterium wieringae]UYO63349.1 EAL domain-containing protein [Acetobacterium wieringae]